MSNNDPKYDFHAGGIINEASQERIPDDEPVMVFRARDLYAFDAINEYLNVLKKAKHEGAHIDDAHIEAVQGRLEAFAVFRAANPRRMKTPDTELV